VRRARVSPYGRAVKSFGKGREVAKIPGQKASHNDITKATRDQIMKEIQKAQKADHCTETFRNKK
jgi:hypothetical protein